MRFTHSILRAAREILSRSQLCWLVSLPLLALIAGGCVKLPAKKPKAEVKSIYGSTNASTSITPTVLQARAMRFADEYSMVIAQAADDFSAKVGTTEARHMAARIKLGQGMAAVINAGGPNPTVNTLDIVVLA